MYQLIVENDNTTSAYFGGVQKRGATVWVRNFEDARHLIDTGMCKWPPAAPQATAAHGGPSEKK